MGFNDKKHCGLLELTGELGGHINDLEHLMLGGVGHINDMWHAYWDSQLIEKGHYNDRAMVWLGTLGYTQNSLSERWYAFWTDACDGNIGTLPETDMIFPLTHSLFGRVDQVDAVANFSRAAGPSTVEDFEGVIHDCLDGEARFWRARRVENLAWDERDTGFTGNAGVVVTRPEENRVVVENFDNTGDNGPRCMNSWMPGRSMTGRTITFSYELRAENPADINKRITMRFRCGLAQAPPLGGDDTSAFLLTDDWVKHEQTISLEEPDDAISDGVGIWLYSHASDGAEGCGMRNWQIEFRDASSDEYVHHAEDYGANVDGVAYFPTDRNGNFLNGMRNCLVEEAGTNEFTWSETMPDNGSRTGADYEDGDVINLGAAVLPKMVSTDAASTQHRAEYANSGGQPATGIDVYVSFLFSPGEIDVGAISVFSATSVIVRGLFNSTSKVITMEGVNGEAVGWEEVAPNVFRVSMKRENNPQTPAGLRVDVGIGAQTSSPSVIPVGEGAYIGGVQVEYDTTHVSTYLPTTSAAATRPAETLSTPRPLALLQPAVNNLVMAIRNHLVSDGSLGAGATLIHITGSTSSDEIMMNTNGTGLQRFIKVIGGVNNNCNVSDDTVSKRRNHVLRMSSTDGMTHTLNGVEGVLANNDDVVTLDGGDGVIHLGTRSAGSLPFNAGIGWLSVYSGQLEQGLGPNIIVNPELAGGAASGPSDGNNAPTSWTIGFNTANSYPVDIGEGAFEWVQNEEEASGRCYLAYDLSANNPDLEVGAKYRVGYICENISASSLSNALSNSATTGITVSDVENGIAPGATELLSFEFTIDDPTWTMTVRMGVGVTTNVTNNLVARRPFLRKIIGDTPPPVLQIDLQGLVDCLIGQGWTAAVTGPDEITVEGNVYTQAFLRACDYSSITPVPLRIDFCECVQAQGFCTGGCP